MTVEQVRASLLEDRVESKEHGEDGVTDAAIAVCEKLATHIGLDSGLNPDHVRMAAFGCDDGSASFALSCEHTGRRIDFVVSSRGSHCICMQMPAKLNGDTAVIPADPDDPVRIRSLTHWVLRG